jgi:Tfp pilus assembly protein PilP
VTYCRSTLLAALALVLFCGFSATAEVVSNSPSHPSDPGAVSHTEAGDTGQYASTGRDPFRPFTLDLKAQRAGDGPLTPLQKYELGQLKVAGVIAGMDPPRAMVEDSSGMGYIVTVGTPMGRNGGVVRAIEPGKIIVEENYLDFYGKEHLNKIVLAVPSEDGEQQPENEKRE